MPEGPEVRVMGHWLRQQLEPPTVIWSAKLLSGRYVRKPGSDNFITQLNQSEANWIHSVHTHGKFLWLKLDNFCIGFTLGMTGNFSNRATTHSRVHFICGGDHQFFFNDTRNFGTVKLYSEHQINRKIQTLGIDVLEFPVTKEYLDGQLDAKSRTLAEFLMDQAVIAGIGNYLKAEILWEAKLSPWRLTGSLVPEEVNALLAAINSVPQRSYQNQGATIRSYKTPDGKRGKFADLFSCYGRKVDPNNDEVVKQTTKDNRSTYWVPSRQL